MKLPLRCGMDESAPSGRAKVMARVSPFSTLLSASVEESFSSVPSRKSFRSFGSCKEQEWSTIVSAGQKNQNKLASISNATNGKLCPHERSENKDFDRLRYELDREGGVESDRSPRSHLLDQVFKLGLHFQDCLRKVDVQEKCRLFALHLHIDPLIARVLCGLRSATADWVSHGHNNNFGGSHSKAAPLAVLLAFPHQF